MGMKKFIVLTSCETDMNVYVDPQMVACISEIGTGTSVIYLNSGCTIHVAEPASKVRIMIPSE